MACVRKIAATFALAISGTYASDEALTNVLPFDDECAANQGECVLNALQHRAMPLVAGPVPWDSGDPDEEQVTEQTTAAPAKASASPRKISPKAVPKEETAKPEDEIPEASKHSPKTVVEPTVPKVAVKPTAPKIAVEPPTPKVAVEPPPPKVAVEAPTPKVAVEPSATKAAAEEPETEKPSTSKVTDAPAGKVAQDAPASTPSTTCHTAVPGEHCYQAVQWAMKKGTKLHPTWYKGVSAFEDFQTLIHKKGKDNCPLPCPSTSSKKLAPVATSNVDSVEVGDV